MFPLRDENPTHRFPVAVVALIALNTLAFIYELWLGQAAETLIYRFGLLPWEIMSGQSLPGSPSVPPILTLLSSMFLHAGFGHIIGNMWFLWLFGDNIEDSIGHFRFLVFYFVCGVVAGLVHVLVAPESTVPTIGASGAISGVLGGYIVLFPRIRIKTLLVLGFFWNVIYVPALFFFGIWFLSQAMGWLGPNTGVAFGAHIGGFLAGAIYTYCLTRPKRSGFTSRYEHQRTPRW